MRQALEPITAVGGVATEAEVRATLETAGELLRGLHHAQLSAFAHRLSEHEEELVAPLAWLEQHLSPWRQGVDGATEALIVWAWQHPACARP